MPLDKVRVQELRAQAHHLTPAVRLGADGVTQGIILSLESRFKRAELVKLQCGKATPVPAEQAADDLSKATKSDIVQVIGRTFTLFRPKGGVAAAAVVAVEVPTAAPAKAKPTTKAADKPAPKKAASKSATAAKPAAKPAAKASTKSKKA